MKNSKSKRAFLQSLQKAARDLGDISEEKILKTVRECRSEQKLPKIAAVIRSKEKGLVMIAVISSTTLFAKPSPAAVTAKYTNISGPLSCSSTQTRWLRENSWLSGGQ
jgi:hypothetical protein